MAGKGSDKSQGGGVPTPNVKTRHSLGSITQQGATRRSLKSSPTSSSSRVKRLSEPRKYDTTNRRETPELRNTSRSQPTTILPSSGGGTSRGSVKCKLPAKPISPSPSESSACKTACSSPDLTCDTRDNNSTSRLDHEWPRVDTCSLQLENQHLKDLLVSQLDLMQQQSETILSREKQLKDLRIENEHLRQRLERMERRVRGTDSESDKSVNTSTSSSTIPKEPTQVLLANPRKRIHSSSTTESNSPIIPFKRIKRESGASSQVTNRRSIDSHTTTSSSATVPLSKLSSKQQTSVLDTPTQASEYSKDKTNTDYVRFDELKDEIFEESDVRFRISSEDINASASGSHDSASLTDNRSQQVTKKDHKQIRKSIQSQEVDNFSIKEEKLTEGSDKSGPPANTLVPLEPLSTHYHYYIGCTNELINKDDKLTECAILQRGVEVPKFKIDTEYDKKMSKITAWSKKNPFHRYLADLEVLDDATFLKRHEKKEQLEKKTKKWDIQRMREITYNEKLKARYAAPSKSKKLEPNTLLPTLEGAEKILVSKDGKLPVSVFGEAVPALNQTNFSLPWLVKRPGAKSDQSSKKNRQSLHLQAPQKNKQTTYNTRT